MIVSTSSSSVHEGSKEVNPLASSSTDHGSCTQQNLTLPIGYRFDPTDTELILNYLFNKILDLPIPAGVIPETDGCIRDPEQLPIGKSQHWKEKEAFFFTCKDEKVEEESKHETELNGFWKADVIDEHILISRKVVALKSKFVFYRVKEGKEEKTNWHMSEFRVNPKLIPDDAKRFVACRIQYDSKEKSLMRAE